MALAASNRAACQSLGRTIPGQACALPSPYHELAELAPPGYADTQIGLNTQIELNTQTEHTDWTEPSWTHRLNTQTDLNPVEYTD